jgi:hypothetical protein
VLGLVALVLALTTIQAYAATPELQTVLNNLRLWIAGLLATLATLFLSIGGLLYLTAAGNTRRIEQAKDAIRSAIIGYIFAGLAPLVVEIVQKITGV